MCCPDTPLLSTSGPIRLVIKLLIINLNLGFIQGSNCFHKCLNQLNSPFGIQMQPHIEKNHRLYILFTKSCSYYHGCFCAIIHMLLSQYSEYLSYIGLSIGYFYITGNQAWITLRRMQEALYPLRIQCIHLLPRPLYRRLPITIHLQPMQLYIINVPDPKHNTTTLYQLHLHQRKSLNSL